MVQSEPAAKTELVAVTVDNQLEAQDESCQPGAMHRAVYAFSYCLSYSVMFPTLLVVRALPLDNALGHGLRAGAEAADATVARVHGGVAHAAHVAVAKTNDAYAGAAQFVQDKVERVQDTIAEHRYRRGVNAAQ